MPDEKQLFSNRLNHALDLIGVPSKNKGRQIVVAKMLGVSQRAVNKWLEGGGFPDYKKLPLIASILKVNLDWLLFGVGDIKSGYSVSRKIPVIKWSTIDSFLKNELDITKIEEWVDVNVNLGEKLYALKVEQDDDSLEPRILPGDILIVNPDVSAIHKGLYIVSWLKTGKASAMQMLINGPNRYLRSINPVYKAVPMDDNQTAVSLGRVIQVIIPL